jgi:hypothetical protein
MRSGMVLPVMLVLLSLSLSSATERPVNVVVDLGFAGNFAIMSTTDYVHGATSNITGNVGALGAITIMGLFYYNELTYPWIKIGTAVSEQIHGTGTGADAAGSVSCYVIYTHINDRS